MSYDTGFIAIAEQYKRIFLQTEGDGFLFQIGKFDSVRNCLVQLYLILLKQKQCEPIEALPESEKRGLWEEAKRISDSKNQKQVIDTCKALHAFGVFIQL